MGLHTGVPRPMTNWYASKEWFKLRAKTRAAWKALAKPCAVCREPLQWHLPHGVIVDHIQNKKQRPDLAYEPANLQCVCHGCNTRKGHYIERSKTAAIGLDGLPDSWR